VRPTGLITLLSDFGTADGYAAAMKGRIYREFPGARVVDAAHDVPPHDVAHAAWVLGQYWDWFPEGTIHVAVVDPGVGTDRGILLGEADGRLIIAPDNGLITWVAARAREWRTRILSTRFGEDIAPTFHGRDLFAVAAARLAAGAVALEDISEEYGGEIRLPYRGARREGKVIHGHVVFRDRFGNLVTDIPEELLGGEAAGGQVLFRGRIPMPLKKTYGDVKRGELLALIGSSRTLEIAVREGSAAEMLDADYGDEVMVRLSRTGGSEGEDESTA